MSAPQLTNKMVRDFYTYMKKKYRFKVIAKANSSQMQGIAWILDKMGIKNKKRFMTQSAITLGETVYVPFKVGICKDNNERIQQICTCVHEAQHVIQYRRSPAKFMWNYITSDAARTGYEVDAYRTNMEMHWFFTGQLLNPVLLANLLKGYAVDKVDIRVALKHYITMGKVVKRGGVMSGPSKAAIGWFKGRKIAPKAVVRHIAVPSIGGRRVKKKS